MPETTAAPGAAAQRARDDGRARDRAAAGATTAAAPAPDRRPRPLIERLGMAAIAVVIGGAVRRRRGGGVRRRRAVPGRHGGGRLPDGPVGRRPHPAPRLRAFSRLLSHAPRNRVVRTLTGPRLASFVASRAMKSGRATLRGPGSPLRGVPRPRRGPCDLAGRRHPGVRRGSQTRSGLRSWGASRPMSRHESAEPPRTSFRTRSYTGAEARRRRVPIPLRDVTRVAGPDVSTSRDREVRGPGPQTTGVR